MSQYGNRSSNLFIQRHELLVDHKLFTPEGDPHPVFMSVQIGEGSRGVQLPDEFFIETSKLMIATRNANIIFPVADPEPYICSMNAILFAAFCKRDSQQTPIVAACFEIADQSVVNQLLNLLNGNIDYAQNG